MGNGQRFGEPERGALSGRVSGIADLAEQGGARGNVHQVTTAAPDHVWHQRSRSIHMRHHVDLPTGGPLLVSRRRRQPIRPVGEGHTGVRDKHIDRPKRRLGLSDQRANISFDADIRLNSETRQTNCDLFRRRLIDISHHHAGALSGKFFAQRATNTMGSASHYDHLICIHHLFVPRFKLNFTIHAGELW